MSGAPLRVWAVCKRELVSFFASPVAYVFIIIFLLLAGFFTMMMGQFFERNEASLDSFFLWHPWLFLVLVPAVGMRLWSEERRSGSIELLLTMPLGDVEAIVGKYLAAWAVIGISLALTFPMVVTIGILGRPDYGMVASGYLGSLLLAGAYLAVSSATSALTRNQVISMIISVVACLFLLLAGWPPVTNMLVKWAPSGLVDTVAAFSVIPNYETLQRGVIDLKSVVYFISLAVFGLFATVAILRNRVAR
jgi:ABC-2 type transport system permease protein